MPSPQNTANQSRSAVAPNPSQTTNPTAKTAVPGADLTELQQLVCNLAGDLVINGGHKTDVENLIRATIGHSFRLRLPWHKEDSWAEESGIVDRRLPEWLQQISRHWPTKTPAKFAEPTTVSEMARANLRSTLAANFEHFLGSARMHELYLLCNVLLNFEGNTRGADNDAAESILAEAFMTELSGDDSYIKVPRGMVETVEEYVAGLNSVPDEEDEMAELTRLWRQDHPEPTMGTAGHPTGHLGRKEDDDDDD